MKKNNKNIFTNISFNQPTYKPIKLNNNDISKKINKSMNSYDMIREKVLDEPQLAKTNDQTKKKPKIILDF